MTYKIRPLAAVIGFLFLAIVLKTNGPVDPWRMFTALCFGFYLLAICWEVCI